MGHNQPMQFNSQEQFVQIPLEIEPLQNSDSNHRRNKWLTIIICIIFAVTGQSAVRLLENYYFLHRNRNFRYGVWTQSLLQVVGFPILLFPFVFLHLSCNKKKQLIMTSDEISRVQLAIAYLILAVFMFYQATFSNIRHGIPFRVFTLIYTTQLLFTPVFSADFEKIISNRWMMISLFFAIITGSFTLDTFSAGSPDTFYRWKKQTYKGISLALAAAFFFSIILCYMRSIFDSIRNVSTNKKQPMSFAAVDVCVVVFTW